MRAEFPKYTVEVKEVSDGSPASVKVTWVTGEAQEIKAQHATLLDILDELEPIARELQWAEEDKEMM